jgi:hypothetical protein
VWAVQYTIVVDDRWRTRSARVTGRSETGAHAVVLEADGEGHWLVDGVPRPDLDGCLDVDLEASACTNTLPLHRLAPAVARAVDSPAAYVRATDLAVERLDQRYTRVEVTGAGLAFDYVGVAFDYRARLRFDDAGLVLEYPGLASRVV